MGFITLILFFAAGYYISGQEGSSFFEKSKNAIVSIKDKTNNLLK